MEPTLEIEYEMRKKVVNGVWNGSLVVTNFCAKTCDGP